MGGYDEFIAPKTVFFGVIPAVHPCSRCVLPSLVKGMTRAQLPILNDWDSCDKVLVRG
jgi:hypothetical protein